MAGEGSWYLNLVEGLAPSQIDSLHRYISSADFELVAYQVIMGRILIALGADQEEVLTNTREALRQGLRPFVVLSPAELMTTTDALLDLLRTAAITVAADFDVNDLGTATARLAPEVDHLLKSVPGKRVRTWCTNGLRAGRACCRRYAAGRPRITSEPLPRLSCPRRSAARSRAAG